MYLRNARGLVVVAALVSAVPALAQQTGATQADPPINLQAARKVALARVPGGKIQHEELEREHGRLVYSFEISAQGKSGTQEVLVDANDGGVMSVQEEKKGHHEDQESEHGDAEDRGAGRERS